jgi:hypothetical protein
MGLRQRLLLWSGATVLTISLGSANAQTTTPPRVLLKNHTMSYGTYLGGGGDDQARGLELLGNGELLAAGNFNTLATKGQISLLRAGVLATAPGKVLRIAGDGRRVLADLTLGNRIDDIAVAPNRDLAIVGGDFGVAMIKPSTMQVLWTKTLPEAAGNGRSEGGQTRVAINARGRVAVLRVKTLRLYDENGVQLKETLVDRDYVNDVAMDNDRNQVYVVGFANRKNQNDINPTTGLANPVQIAFLYAYSANDLSFRWRTWDFNPNLLTPSSTPGSAPENNMADSRLYRVIVGPDGKIIVLGESAGGNTIFRWNGKDFITPTLIKKDVNSDPFNSKSPHFLYYAKIDANSGKTIAGRFAIPRLDSTFVNGREQVGLANAFRGRDGTIATDAKGNIYIGGISAYSLPERNENKINGIPVAPYKTFEMVMLQSSADLQTRLRWTPFSLKQDGGGTLNAIAVGRDRVYIWGSANTGGLYTSRNALRTQPFAPLMNKPSDAYLGILTNIIP